ncbi:hypothetical protein PV10_00644 [Exophiala mesophila]|uniref:Thioesterase domain-containing protein n=1 Tax=Exophiala mesophila TaxID=212818 RepID=A0A0D1ZQD5_EXOME|nr:uncharacterized protein PV10_00644 [Exophiala mesophila]KIV96827.1 hypothetical protein PV10_00644 [Exophiala mesophila]
MKSNIPTELTTPWCRQILEDPKTEIFDIPSAATETGIPDISNSMFLRTLYKPDGIRAQINFIRPTSQPEAVTGREFCYLMYIGDGLDGKTGRAHGGFNALVLDHMCGWVAATASSSRAPLTASLTIDYKAPIQTPGIIFCRGWLLEMSGRKTWIQSVIEDEDGNVLAKGKALFVTARDEVKI